MNLNSRFYRVRLIATGVLLSPLAVAGMALGQATPAPVKPAASSTASASKPPVGDPHAAAKIVNEAVQALLKEYAAYANDSKTNQLRATADYFTQNKPAGLTDAAIIAALNVRHSSDAAADGYVKWQLLSGLSATIDPKSEPQLLLAYRSMPTLFVRPGMSTEDKRELDDAIRGMKHPSADQINDLNTKLTGIITPWQMHNLPILSYREAMYGKVPVSYDSLVAGLKDGYERVTAGVDSESFGLRLRDSIRKWDNGSQPREQIVGMSEILLKIINEEGGMPPKKTEGPAFKPEILADAVRPYDGPGDDAHAPVLLAAGNKFSNNNYNNQYGKMGFPPKYYERVDYDIKTDQAAWVSEAAKFMTREQMADLYENMQTELQAPAK